ncbi:MAG: iron-containing alcohol dehydrogenase [Planctomycetia bacterium]|nr:iron-containing alcohol dehydrogenase [Planctomycetia bacterium]
MSAPFDFFSPQRIVFGWGRRTEAGPLAATLGRRAFLVVGSRTLARSGAIAELTAALEASGIEVSPLATISHEPLTTDVDEATALLKQAGLREGDFLVAVGGGSAIDLAKAVAAMATQDADAVTGTPPRVVDYLEGVGRGYQLVVPPLPIMALPTTGGTGTEATKNAVISSYEPAFKKSLRDPRLVPRIVLVDPELSVGLSPETTAWTGMDAITQLIEAFITRNARPIPQALCLEGLRLALPAVEQAVRDGTNRPAREAMAQAALFSGMALANSGLGLAHGVAAALGVICRVPHGLACAVMLPAALAANRETSQADLARLARYSLNLSIADDASAAQALVDRVAELCRSLQVPRTLGELGVRKEQLPALVAGSKGNSLNGNPRPIASDELQLILERML